MKKSTTADSKTAIVTKLNYSTIHLSSSLVVLSLQFQIVHIKPKNKFKMMRMPPPAPTCLAESCPESLFGGCARELSGGVFPGVILWTVCPGSSARGYSLSVLGSAKAQKMKCDHADRQNHRLQTCPECILPPIICI